MGSVQAWETAYDQWQVALATDPANAGEGPPELFTDVIGGIGLASLLLLRLCPPGADPLGPHNPLIFATSPFAGTGITTSSKIAGTSLLIASFLKLITLLSGWLIAQNGVTAPIASATSVEQIDSPEAIYYRPASEFIYTFIGESCCLPVRIDASTVCDETGGVVALELAAARGVELVSLRCRTGCL